MVEPESGREAREAVVQVPALAAESDQVSEPAQEVEMVQAQVADLRPTIRRLRPSSFFLRSPLRLR